MNQFSESVRLQDENQELFAAFFYKSPVMQVLTEAATGKIIDVNNRFCSFYDYNREELCGKTLVEMGIMVNPHDREIILQRIMNEGSVHDIELLERTRCGTLKWISASVNLLKISGKDCLLGIGIDITHRKIFETEIKKLNIGLEEKVRERTQEIRHFTNYLHRVQEEERARISREIHDELGQQLIGMKMGLISCQKKFVKDAEINQRITEMIKDVDEALAGMRRIITQLRPGILDTLGLIPSIEWLAREFETKTGIKCKLNLPVSAHNYKENLATCFFRICQEALTNVAKHSGATEVEIRIKQEGEKLIMEVSDNGHGIPKEHIRHPHSFGLTGMRERAIIIGGELEISGRENKGTTVILKANTNLE